MESKILMAANRQIKKNRPFFSNEKICEVFRSGNLMEIGFLSHQCRNDQCGSCIMCDYGAATGAHSTQEYLDEMDRILGDADDEVDILLICTNGSFLDSSQVNSELFQAVLERAAKAHAGLIEIETHYRDVTVEKLRRIKALLPDKTILIEMGLETINPLYQSHIIMKGINLPDYERTISLIQSVGFFTEVNIMIGMPFLSAKEQFEDAAETIQWAFSHNCRPALFPMNIKPYTLLMEMYRSGHYSPISQWMLPLLLKTLSNHQLENITIAWYGNREEIYTPDQERAIFPRACPVCTTAIRNFYQQFLVAQKGSERKALLEELFAQNGGCSCLDKAMREIATEPTDSFAARYADYISYIKTYGPGGDVV